MADESNEAEDAAVVEADTALTEDEPEKHIEDLKGEKKKEKKNTALTSTEHLSTHDYCSKYS